MAVYSLAFISMAAMAMAISTVQYSTVQYSTVQYSTVQYSTIQYSMYTDAAAVEIMGRHGCPVGPPAIGLTGLLLQRRGVAFRILRRSFLGSSWK
jgi:hypothetical protein